MNTHDVTRTTRKSSRLKKLYRKVTLKAVLRGAYWCFCGYRAVSKLIDFVKESMD